MHINTTKPNSFWLDIVNLISLFNIITHITKNQIQKEKWEMKANWKREECEREFPDTKSFYRRWDEPWRLLTHNILLSNLVSQVKIGYVLFTCTTRTRSKTSFTPKSQNVEIPSQFLTKACCFVLFKQTQLFFIRTWCEFNVVPKFLCCKFVWKHDVNIWARCELNTFGLFLFRPWSSALETIATREDISAGSIECSLNHAREIIQID